MGKDQRAGAFVYCGHMSSLQTGFKELNALVHLATNIFFWSNIRVGFVGKTIGREKLVILRL